jgi:uncharacterized coiled-coil protein SlyX
VWMAVSEVATVTNHIPWQQFVAGSVIAALVSVVAFGVRALIKGDLVPHRVLEDVEERADKWETAWGKGQDTIRELAEQVTELKEIGRTTEALLRSVVDRSKDKDPA